MIESLILTGRLITFPIFRSQSNLYQKGLQNLYIKDYERLQQILKPYVKDVENWVEKIRDTDEEHSKIKLALEEMKKIVEDKSLVGFVSGTCRSEDDPWVYQIPVSILGYNSINSFLRCVHLVV